MAPFQSFAQRSYLKHNEPGVYRRWKKEAGDEPVHKVLHVKGSRKKGKRVLAMLAK